MSGALLMLALSAGRTNGIVHGQTRQGRQNAICFGFCAMALGKKKLTHPIYSESRQDLICLPVTASADILHIFIVVPLNHHLHCGAYGIE